MKSESKNGYTFNKNGWKYISIKGKPKERGYAYGFACAKEFSDIQKMLKFFMYESYGREWSFFIEKINDDFKEMTKKDFNEFYEEMEGIAEGCTANGCKTTVDEIIAWNFYMSIPYWYPSWVETSDNINHSSSSKSMGPREGGSGGAKDHCSAFIAVGKDWTEDGKIVVAHNSFCDYIDGQYSNVVLDIAPEDGFRIIMQTSPCWIWSGTDFFVTSKGIIGTETTIGGFLPYVKKYPVGYRIRKAMQYGKTLDDYVKILLDGNSGDYANSWLFGDTNTNEILRLELGLQFHNVERTKNGYFIGFNATYDPQIRNIECVNSGFYDVRRHQGARQVRLAELMDENKGKLNIEIAKKIIADHYDVYLQKDNKCSRTVCSHYDLDPREYMSAPGRPVPFSPHGAVDGFVCDTKMANNMIICGRYGNSCGTPFIKDEFIKKHRQYENFGPYLKDRPTEEWTDLSADSGSSESTRNSGHDNQEGGSSHRKHKFRLTRRGKNRNHKHKTLKSH
uniref:Uncharacterized protein n=1 Tax=viral metagenome TaxID=1070528 RepID=A0A6C0JI88_9ZZZZ